MSPPLLILVAGPNGAGKTTLYETVLAPRFPTLAFVNADRIAAERWPGAEVTHGRAASKAAARMRARLTRLRGFALNFAEDEKVFLYESMPDLWITTENPL